jgi:hypothetical protein
MDAAARLSGQSATFAQGTDREREDVILTNVISFDVRVFDPKAKAQASGTMTLYPGDPGYTSGSGASGAYIDLGGGQGGRLAQAPEPNSGLVPSAVPTGVATYDTWSQSYTFGGSGLNDPATYTRAPPYSVPLEGVEVRIRCYDPTSKQVRQVSVRQTFRR